MTADLTVVINAHAETVVAGPTMRSAELAIAAVERVGFGVERLIGLRAPTPQCCAFFAQFVDWSAVEFEFSDSYRVRNALARRARGQWIAFMDSGDLMSENWLANAATMLKEAERRSERVIVCPELNWGFGVSGSVIKNPTSADPYYGHGLFDLASEIDQSCIAPRPAYLEVPHSPSGMGCRFANTQFLVRCIAAGWRQVVARDTIIFRRNGSSAERHPARGRCCDASVGTVDPSDLGDNAPTTLGV